MKEIFADKSESSIIEIQAFLSKSQYDEIQNGNIEVEIPSRTEMANKAGSRILRFTCYGKKAATELTDGLDSSSVSWQEMYFGEDISNSSIASEFSSLEQPSHQE